MRIDFRTRKLQSFGGQGHLYQSNEGSSGVCRVPECGWHAELSADGLCKTRDCREVRRSGANLEIRKSDGKGNVTRLIVW